MSFPKRLIEIDLPIKRISAHARREKSIRHGHISTLHIWWARRPLAACRAVICAALWPDPADPLCPSAFRNTARELMQKWVRDHLDLLGEESFRNFVIIQKNPEKLYDNKELRRALLDFIADFADWNNCTKREYIATSRSLTRAAHEALSSMPGGKPLLVDPFAGGGSIPLEALRVGADAFASELNPVAVLLNKVVLEYIPNYGKRLADEVRKWGEWIKKEAQKDLASFYPNDADGAIPIAYLWARRIACEGPACGCEVPLIQSPWLARTGRRTVALRIIPRPEEMRVDFEIVQNVSPRNVGKGTVSRGSVSCPCCGFTTSVSSVRRQLRGRKGGAADARLLAVVTNRPGQHGRFYRLPTEQDLEVVRKAANELERRERKHIGDESLVPDEELPIMSGVFNAPIYGHDTWGTLFTPRQALALTTLSRLCHDTGERLGMKLTGGLDEAVQTCLALAVDRQADKLSSLARWDVTRENPQGTFGRQALPMVWNFDEVNPLSGSGGDWDTALGWVIKVIEKTATIFEKGSDTRGQAELATATAHPLPDSSAQCIFTDPPYYNAVPYADLSDFFYVWLKRTIGTRYPDLYRENLAPKEEEICEMAGWDPDRYHHKDGKWFESRMTEAMSEGRRILAPDGVGVVVFAHKSTSGWEALLQAMIDAGWMITGSWPIDTEMGSRLRAMNSAVLASSVHLVCRPREMDNIGDWRDLLQELPQRIHDWLPRLSEEGIVGADAIFSCLGPALEIFSRYSRVEKASGELVTLKEYLEHVWATVAREALSMIFEGADATGFEEDARLTAIWLWTLATGGNGNGSMNAEDETRASTGYLLEYDAARKIAQGLGAHLDRLTSLVEVKGERARLLPVSERTRFLFGKEDAQPTSVRRTKKSKQIQLGFLEEPEEAEEQMGFGEKVAPTAGRTVLDHLHQSMILFAAGRGEALKRFLVEEGIGQDQRFWRLAQALSALYPANVDEKRWVDGVLARKKGLGF